MSDMQEIKRLIDEQGTAWSVFKETNDAAIADAKSDTAAIKKAQSDYEAELAKINAALDEAGKKADEAFKRANRPAAGPDESSKSLQAEIKSFAANKNRRGGEVNEENYVAYKGAFEAFIRANGNIEALSDTQRKAMSIGTDSDGGYLVTEEAVNSIVTKMREMSMIRSIAGNITISTNAVEGLVDRGDNTASWVAELGSRTSTTTPTLGQDRINVNDMYSFPQVSQSLLEDAAVNLETWLNDKVAISFAELEDTAFVSGTGVGRPRGLNTYTTAATADGSRTWGTIQHIATGVSGGFAASNPSDHLFDTDVALKTGYKANAKWLMNRTTLGAIRKFKNSAGYDYLWQPGLSAGAPSVLIGYPVILDENMGSFSTASALCVALGDFNRGYCVVDRVGMSVLRDPYSNKPYVGFYYRRRVGGAVRDFDAIKFIKASTL